MFRRGPEGGPGDSDKLSPMNYSNWDCRIKVRVRRSKRADQADARRMGREGPDEGSDEKQPSKAPTGGSGDGSPAAPASTHG